MKKIFFAAALAGAAMLASCGGNKSGVQMGSLSDFDSLSYSLGANIGYGMSYEMKDIPFDFKLVDKGIKEGAMGKASQEHDKSLDMLREYFMSKRGERAQAIAEKRAAADSVRLAGGDSTKVEYPAADPEMFESEEERAEISYAFGNDIGYNVAQSGMPIQLVWISEAMQNVRDNNAKMTEDEVNQYLQYYFMVKRPAENAEASKAWLEKMEKKSARRGEGALYGPYPRRQGVRHLEVRQPLEGAAGDDQETASRRFRQGRARRVPAQPCDSRLDRGSATGGQGRQDHALDSRRPGLRCARRRP